MSNDDPKEAKPPAPTPPAAKPAAPAKPAEPEKPAPDTSPLYRRIRERMPEAISPETHVHQGDLVLVAPVAKLVDLFRLCKSDPELDCDYLTSVTAIDYPDRPKRFEVVWTLVSIGRRHRFHVVAQVADGEDVPSVRDLWRTSDWQEREVWDMFGIRFAGHPDLRRILLPDWWEGHPLRKDYPLEGRGEHEKVVEESLRPKQ